MGSPTGRRAVAGVVVVFLTVMLSLGGTASAAAVTTQPTFVDTNVTSDTVWTSAEGPYRVTTDIAITEGATLTIEPGTTVEFVDGASLHVRGQLDASEPGDQIVFESFREPGNASAGAWTGLLVSGQVRLHDARITDATTGLKTRAGGNLTATDLVVARASADGIGVGDGSQVTLQNASFGSLGERDIRLGVEAEDQTGEGDDWPAGLEIRASTLPHGVDGDLEGSGEATFVAVGTTFDAPVDIEVDAVRLRGSTVDTRFRLRDDPFREVRSVSLIESTVTADGALVAKADEDLNGTVGNNRVDGRVRLANPTGMTVRANEVDGGQIILGGFSVDDVRVTDNRITNGSIRLAASDRVDGSMTDNRAYGGRTPLLVRAEFVYGMEVTGNGVYGAEGTGIALRSAGTGESGDLAIHNNTVVESGTGIGVTFAAGRSLYNPGQNSTLRGNLLAANDRGLVIDKSLTTRVFGNRIVDNGVGVRLDSVGLNEEQVYAVDRNDLSGNEIGLEYLGPAELTVTAEQNYWGAESGPAYPAIVPDGDGVRVRADGPTVDVIPFASTPPAGLPASLPTPTVSVETAADGTVTVTPGGVDSAARYFVSFGNGTWSTVTGGAAEHTYQGAVNATVVVYAIGADGRASVPPVREAVAVTTPTPTPTPAPPSTPTPEGAAESDSGPTASAATATMSPHHTTAHGQPGFGIVVVVVVLLGGQLAAHRR